jgi:hypothetical protein
MAHYYHVVGDGWRPGDDLWSFNDLVARGGMDQADWKWKERPYEDGSDAWIFLFATLDEALEIDSNCLEDVRRDPVEGYPYVHGPIPADCLEEAR